MRTAFQQTLAHMSSTQSSDPAKRLFIFPSLGWLGAAVVVAAACAWMRFELIEPLARAAACTAAPDTALCQLRAAVIALFQGERMGWAALGVALLAALLGWRWLAGMALLGGAAALMLYSVEPGAVAALLATLLLLRRASNA